MIILSQNTLLIPIVSVQTGPSANPEIISFQVYTTPTYGQIPSGNPYYVGTAWQPPVPNQVDKYNIYKSIIGFQTPKPVPYGLVYGDTLELEVNNTAKQVITFTKDYDSINELVTFINSAVVGATAYVVGQGFMLRDNIQGYIKLLGGNALAKFGQTPRTITEKSETFLVVTVPVPQLSYDDLNGFDQDWYSITTTSNIGVESLPSTLISPSQSAYGRICNVTGYILNLQGQRQADVRVTAKIESPPQGYPPNAYITTEEVWTLTQEDGSFSLPLLQGSTVYLEINRAKVSEHVLIPYLSYMRWDSLQLNSCFYDYKDKLYL